MTGYEGEHIRALTIQLLGKNIEPVLKNVLFHHDIDNNQYTITQGAKSFSLKKSGVRDIIRNKETGECLLVLYDPPAE